MNKKGFTLLEVMISVVLVSIVLTSMLATLVKIKDSYDVIYKNTDALIFGSSLARIINNDFEKNGGIRYIDCNYGGNICDVVLNSDEKRQLEIYNVQVGKSISEYLKEDSNSKIDIEDICRSIGYIDAKQITKEELEEKIDVCRKFLENHATNVFCEPSIIENKKKFDANCTKSSESISCKCMKQKVSTTFRYSNTTNGGKSNIYLKTLSLDKMTDIKNNSNVTTRGYNFGKMSYTNISYDSSNKFTKSNVPYKNSISTITIELNDGIDTLDSSYNILLSSTSSYSPDKVQVGNMLCFGLDNFGTINLETDGVGVIDSVEQKINSFCVKYGAGFFVEKGGKYSKVSKLNTYDLVSGTKDLDKIIHIPKDKSNKYLFNGYYYELNDESKMPVIDKDGNILISTTNFDSDGLVLRADWKQK